MRKRLLTGTLIAVTGCASTQTSRALPEAKVVPIAWADLDKDGVNDAIVASYPIAKTDNAVMRWINGKYLQSRNIDPPRYQNLTGLDPITISFDRTNQLDNTSRIVPADYNSTLAAFGTHVTTATQYLHAYKKIMSLEGKTPDSQLIKRLEDLGESRILTIGFEDDLVSRMVARID